MMLAASMLFLLSLGGIIALFALKYREAERDLVYAAEARRRLDERARHLKQAVLRFGAEAEKIPPRAVALSHFLIRDLALLTARAGEALERRAYRLADMVSHKHRFERRETRSDFLKQMNEAKVPDSSMDKVLEE